MEEAVQPGEGPAGYAVALSGPSGVPDVTFRNPPVDTILTGCDDYNTLSPEWVRCRGVRPPPGVQMYRSGTQPRTPSVRSEVLIGLTVHQPEDLLTYPVTELEGGSSDRKISQPVRSHKHVLLRVPSPVWAYTYTATFQRAREKSATYG